MATTIPFPNEAYLVGQIRVGEQWEFQGMFSTEELADNACIHQNYFYIKVELDKELSHETTYMDNICFPRCLTQDVIT